jgi:carbon storage regulator
MLVLTRRVGEEIVIANDIHLTVLEVNGQRVRLGITAPSTVRVLRMELLNRNRKPVAVPQGGRINGAAGGITASGAARTPAH